MTAPERICLLPDDGWSWVKGPKPPYEENAIEYVRSDLAAVQPAHVQPDPAAIREAALHRSFPDAGDGRPMPPMGDELMTAGLSTEDARFVAVQLAHRGLKLVPTEDAATSQAADDLDAKHQIYMRGKGRDPEKYASQFSLARDAILPLIPKGAAE